jgi:hypothetical protein
MTNKRWQLLANDVARMTIVALIRHHVAMTWPDVKCWMENLIEVSTGFLLIIYVSSVIQNKT